VNIVSERMTCGSLGTQTVETGGGGDSAQISEGALSRRGRRDTTDCAALWYTANNVFNLRASSPEKVG
jgi:hypothetical protein